MVSEICWDVGWAPARKIPNVICDRSGQPYYLDARTGQSEHKMLWPELARRSEKCAWPALMSRTAALAAQRRCMGVRGSMEVYDGS